MKIQIGNILRCWRKRYRYSQLQLATELGVSSKHISFIETGRSRPSRQMLLNIALFLNVAKSEINRALITAGFAPAYHKLNIEDEKLKPVLSAFNQMLENHMPYPAIVLNQSWDLVQVNRAAVELLTQVGFVGESNFLQALINDDESDTSIINWQESMAQVLIRLRNEICTLGGHEQLENYEKQLSKKVNDKTILDVFQSNDTVLTTQIKIKEDRYSLFSIIANLGSVQDVVISEFKIELMFPADEATKEYFRGIN